MPVLVGDTMKKFFRARYRIRRDVLTALFVVEKRPFWWPFWTLVCCVDGTKEGREIIREIKNSPLYEE
jgi:hypothetical protein